MADRREKDQLPVEIVVITNFNDVDGLKRELKHKGVDLDRPDNGVHVAGTSLDGTPVYRLGGIIRPDGTGSPAMSSTLNNLSKASPSDFGEWPISDKGLSDDTVRTVWWYTVNGHYEVVSKAASLARKDDETGQQAQTFVNRVQEHLQQRYDALSMPIADIESYDAAEELLRQVGAAGIGDLRDLERDLKSQLRDASRADGMRDEIRARDAYRKILGMFASKSLKDRNNAAMAMEQLANALPETTYGKRAAARETALAEFVRMR